LNGTYPAENRRQQIAHGQIFDLSVAIRGPNLRTLQKAMAMVVIVVIVIVIILICYHSSRYCQISENRGCPYSSHLDEITARPLDSYGQIFQIRHLLLYIIRFIFGKALYRSHTMILHAYSLQQTREAKKLIHG
jgi:Na+/melibiose symporter-like transporter